ncbi:MAG: M48 family metallopeptidase [Primorskyibacter sp.]
MKEILLPGSPPVVVVLRRSARARRMSLRISRLDGRVTLTIPDATPLSQAQAFAQDKAAWLRRHLAQQQGPVRAGWGAVIPLEGVPHKLVPAPSGQIHQALGVIEVPGPLERVPARLRGWIKERARARLTTACDHYADRLGRGYTRITLRDTRSRWGSCTAQGGLMFSWRLMLAPPQVLDYVAAHEIAHLAHMDHSPRYWACVGRIYGDPTPDRAWLRTHGPALHRYRFED